MSRGRSSNSKNPRLFLVGPGLIGGTLLLHLRKVRPNWILHTLVRSDKAAKEWKEFGVEAIIGSLSDHDILEKECGNANIVIYTAGADDLPSAKACAEGIIYRTDRNRKLIYIHTSGNDELVGSAQSITSESERTLSDTNGDNYLESGRILPDALHRQVD